MILPSLNIPNCGKLLRAENTIPSGNEMANRKNVSDWTIRSQATLKEAEGSTTTESTLSQLFGMEKTARMGWLFSQFSANSSAMMEPGMGRKSSEFKVLNSVYFAIRQEKISRYSLTLRENVGRQDKEPVDNILEIKKQGDTVHIRTLADITVFDHQKGMVLPRQRPESPEIEMNVNRGKGWNILIDDVDAVQSDIGLLDKFTGDASKQINISVDQTLLGSVYAYASANNCGATAGKESASYNLGASGAPIQVTKSDIIDYITYCGGCLDEQNVPDEDRWMVIPSWMAVLLKGSDLKDASLSGDPKSIIRTGLLGMIDRFVIYQSNSIGTVAATVDASGFKCYYVLFGNKDAISFANQFTKTESLRSTDSFDTIVRGLMVWDYKVVKPEALGYMYARR